MTAVRRASDTAPAPAGATGPQVVGSNARVATVAPGVDSADVVVPDTAAVAPVDDFDFALALASKEALKDEDGSEWDKFTVSVIPDAGAASASNGARPAAVTSAARRLEPRSVGLPSGTQAGNAAGTYDGATLDDLYGERDCGDSDGDGDDDDSVDGEVEFDYELPPDSGAFPDTAAARDEADQLTSANSLGHRASLVCGDGLDVEIDKLGGSRLMHCRQVRGSRVFCDGTPTQPQRSSCASRSCTGTLWRRRLFVSLLSACWWWNHTQKSLGLGFSSGRGRDRICAQCPTHV